MTTLKQRILDKLNKFPHGASLEEILNDMNTMPHVLIPELDKLVAEGKVRAESLLGGHLYHKVKE